MDRNRIDAVFEGGRRALICYLPLGDPRVTGEAARIYAECGVDVLEIGVPGAYPYLDGPTIADSLRRAADAGVTADSAADLIAAHRQELADTAMVWMTYPDTAAPEPLLDAVARSGVDGMLFPASARRFGAFAHELERHGVHFIHFLRYDPGVREIALAARSSRGYVMLQATTGVTGRQNGRLPDSAAVIEAVRRLGLRTPIALGIGVSSPGRVREAVEMGAQGVIVGSATVEAGLEGERALATFIRSMREALDGR
jgi:tryptophan synthase alpha chain